MPSSRPSTRPHRVMIMPLARSNTAPLPGVERPLTAAASDKRQWMSAMDEQRLRTHAEGRGGNAHRCPSSIHTMPSLGVQTPVKWSGVAQLSSTHETPGGSFAAWEAPTAPRKASVESSLHIPSSAEIYLEAIVDGKKQRPTPPAARPQEAYVPPLATWFGVSRELYRGAYCQPSPEPIRRTVPAQWQRHGRHSKENVLTDDAGACAFY